MMNGKKFTFQYPLIFRVRRIKNAIFIVYMDT